MKKIIYFHAAALLLLLFKASPDLPETNTVKLASIPKEGTAYLMPLDSRPVCTSQPQKLATLAGTHLILPPKELLDNYRQPGDREKLLTWTKKAVQTKPQAVYLSTDMLLSGGLIAARQAAPELTKQLALLKKLDQLQQSKVQLHVFSLIPRLLVSDELIPDRWYKYRLLRYSQFYHQALVTGEYLPALKQQEYAEKIPATILEKYRRLFHNSLLYNQLLAEKSQSGLSVTIGQDDGHPWGLPTYTAELLQLQLDKKPQLQSHLTYGADEIASTLIAHSYLQKQQLKPRVYFKYADKSLPNLYMPYMAASIDAVLREKLQLIGAQATDQQAEADIILYVSCGHDDYHPSEVQAQELQLLLSANQPVALIDLSANFETFELLLPQLLQHKVPLNRLIAYGGWNTFSNSAGTALAQATIFWGRKQELKQPKEQLALYANNLQLLTEQLLDNYYYQKEYHAELKRNLLWRGVEPTDLSAKDKAVAEAFIQSFMKRKGQELLENNLGKTPFYSDTNGKYYLKNYSVSTSLPWNRIFEIDLQTYNFQIGCILTNP